VISLSELKLVNVIVKQAKATQATAGTVTFKFPFRIARGQKVKAKTLGCRIVDSGFPSVYAEYLDKHDVRHALSPTLYWQGYSITKDLDVWLRDDVKELRVFPKTNVNGSAVYVEISLEVYE